MNATKDSRSNKIKTISVPAYVSVLLEGTIVNCLVDTGAAYSICSKSVVPKNAVLLPTSIKLSGVTGTALRVLGITTLTITLGNVQIPSQFVVVDKINNNEIILGRDFMVSNDCEISFKDLVFKIKESQLPIIKSTSRPVKYALKVNASNLILPNSSALIKCAVIPTKATKHNKTTHKSYVTVTGVFSPNNTVQNELLLSPGGFYNAKKGFVEILVRNNSGKTAEIIRNTKIGSFDTVNHNLVESINSCYRIQSRSKFQSANVHSTTTSPDHTRDPQGPVTKERWVGNKIEELYQLLKLDQLNHLTSDQISQVKALIHQYRDIFSEHDDDIGCTDLMQQTIELDTQVPIRAKYRNIPLAQRAAAEREVKRLLDLGVIQLSESPYHSPSFLLKKPNGNGWRILTDFRQINKHVIRNYQCIPSLEMMSACWKGCKLYSKMDFTKGYYQANLDPRCSRITATCIPGVAFFEYLKSPLGLSSSPGFFQSLVQRIMMGIKSCVCYLDDVLTGSKTFEGMLDNLRQIFDRIVTSKMLLSPKKVELFQKELKFLGVRLGEKGLSACPDKVAAIQDMLPPKNARGIKTFLGMTGFFRKFCRNYAKIAAPLTALLKKDVPFEWGQPQQDAFDELKRVLSESPTLLHPALDKKFTLITDSSSYAIGSILCQRDEREQLHPVAFASKVLTDAEQKWSIVQKELFSLKYFCEKFRTYLINQDFDVYVDNSALLHLDTFKHSDNKRLWRWFETLQNYRFKVYLKPSKENPSDAPSRLVQRNDPNITCLPENAECSINTFKEVQDEHVKIYNVEGKLVPDNDESIRTAQLGDNTIAKVLQWISSGSRPQSSRELSPDEKTYFNSYHRLSVKNGLLYRSWEPLNCSSTNKQLLCIPHVLQNDIIDICHSIPLSGHYGKEKTFAKLTSRFYFPKMRQKLELFIDNCELCIKKAQNKKNPKAPLQPFVATYPNDVLQIDIIENLPSSNGYHAILTMIDRYTMYAEAVPLRNTKVETIARAVLNEYISRHGIPTAVYSDRGGNVHTADLIQALYRIMKIDKFATTARRPQGNGGCERFNGTLKRLLWAYCQENPKNWVNCLDQVLFAYRTTVHSSTNYSPFFLRYGTHPRLPVDVITGTLPHELVDKPHCQYARDLFYKLHDVYEFVRKHLNAKQVSMKKRWDRNAHVKHYNVNDWVYVWKPAPPKCDFRKFYDHYKGPFKITAKVTDYTYKIELHEGKFDIVHTEKLRAAKPPKPKNHVLPKSTEAARNVAGNTIGSRGQDRQVFVRDVPCQLRQSSRVRQPPLRLTYDDQFDQLSLLET